MRVNSAIEDEIDRIRAEIYEETKDMSPAELTEYYKRNTEELVKQYGFTIIDHVPERRGAGAGEGA
jgi:hypothetical protein